MLSWMVCHGILSITISLKLGISIFFLIVFPISWFFLLVYPHLFGSILVASSSATSAIIATNIDFLPVATTPTPLVQIGTSRRCLEANLSIRTCDTMKCNSEPLSGLLCNVEGCWLPGELNLLIFQLKTFGVVVRIRDVTKVHVVHVLIAQVAIFCKPPKALHLLGIAARKVSAFIKGGQTIPSVIVDLSIRFRLEAIWRYLEAFVLLIFDDILSAISTAAGGATRLATRATEQVADFALDLLCHLLSLVDNRSRKLFPVSPNTIRVEFCYLLRAASPEIVDLSHDILSWLEKEFGPSQPCFAFQFAISKLEDTLNLSSRTADLCLSVEANARRVDEKANALICCQGYATIHIGSHHI